MDIQLADTNDIDEIVSFYHSYNFALITRDWLQWKYFDNPVGTAMMFKIMQKTSLVGAVSIIPQLFYYSSQPIIGLQTVDGLLGKEIRGKGFFNDLMEFLSTQLPKGISEKFFYLSFPSLAVSVKAHTNAGWRHLSNFQLKTAILNPEAFFQKRGFGKIGKGLVTPWKLLKKKVMSSKQHILHVQEVKDCFSKMNAFASEDKVCGDRSDRFMRWRVLKNPRDQMRVLAFSDDNRFTGYAACKFSGGVAEIMDIKSEPGMFKIMVRNLLRYIDTRHLADSVDFWTMDKMTARLLTPALGFWRRSASGALFVSHHQACGLPDDPNKWAISYLDSDW